MAVRKRPAALRGQIFRGRDAVGDGLISPDDLRGPAWRRLFQGVYMDSSVEVTHAILCRAAIAYALPDDAVIGGRSAAALYGAGLEQPLDPVEALVPRSTGVRPYKGLVIHRGTLLEGERERVAGLWTTTPTRTCWDLARWLPAVEAATVVDRLLGLERVSVSQLSAYLDRRSSERPRPRGWRRFEALLPLLDGRSESPQETRLRVRFMLAGLPTPQVQYKIYTAAGRFVARVDLAWPEFCLGVEYDGLWHMETSAQIHADRKRLNAIQLEGWTILHVTSQRLRTDFDGIVAEVRAAMRRG